jgi:hypothetical protein
VIVAQTEQLLKEYHDVFAWSYKDFTGILPHIAQYQIELDINIPPTPNMVSHESKLRDNCQVRLGQIVSCQFHYSNGGSYMAFTNYGCPQEK